MTLGGGYRLDFADFIDSAGGAVYLSLDVFGIIAFMPKRDVVKSSVEPVLQDYSFGGVIYNIGGGITFGF